MPDRLTFTLPAAPPTHADDCFAGPWSLPEPPTAIGLAGASRDDSGSRTTRSVSPGALFELQWQDGLVTWTSAEQIARASGASRDGNGALELPAARPGTGARGFVSAALKAWRLLDWIEPEVTDTLRGELIQKADDAVSGLPREEAGRLYHVTAPLLRGERDAWRAPPDLGAGGPYLLFLHGTFSSIPGSFGGLVERDAEPFERLARAYGPGRVLGFQHRTVSRSPVENALALLDQLPSNAELHVVSHSRGGLVGELLARPPTPADEAILRGMEATTELGSAQFAHELRQLARRAAQKSVRVSRFLRVAAPMRGTSLASERPEHVLSALSVLANGLALFGAPGAGPVALAIGGMRDVAKALTSEFVHRVTVCPGLLAMHPGAALARFVARDTGDDACTRGIVAGTVDARAGMLGALADVSSSVVFAHRNDLVVDTPYMFGYHDDGRAVVLTPAVWHLGYFRDADTRARMIDWMLARPSSGFLPVGRIPDRGIAGLPDLGVLKADPTVRKERDVVVLLPGIMGTHLDVGEDRVWASVTRLLTGGFTKLTGDAKPVGLVRGYYDELLERLETEFEVRLFPYDWRHSLATTGKELSRAVQALLAAGRRVHLVGHSMGGVVARVFAARDGQTWGRLRAGGGRFVQLGSPNGGSWEALRGLVTHASLVNALVWADLVNGRRGIQDTLLTFDGLLQLMPAPSRLPGPLALWSPAAWATYARDLLPGSGAAKAADPAFAARLADAHRVRAILDDAPPLDGMAMVLGASPSTPSGVDVVDGRLVWRFDEPGDGTVTDAQARLPGVPVRYVPAAHGDIPDHPHTATIVSQFLRTGATDAGRETRPAVSRDAGALASADLAPPPALPSDADLLRLAMGSRRVERGEACRDIRIRVTHGSLESARYPVLVGHHTQEGILGAERALDRALGGLLTEAWRAGNYPGEAGTCLVRTRPESRPHGAVVMGMGEPGAATMSSLRDGVARAVREYLLHLAAQSGPDVAPLRKGLSVLLVGTGHADRLTPSDSVSVILEGVAAALATVTRNTARAGREFEEIEFIELYEHLALAASTASAAFATHVGRWQRYGVRFVPSERIGEGELRQWLYYRYFPRADIWSHLRAEVRGNRLRLSFDAARTDTVDGATDPRMEVLRRLVSGAVGANGGRTQLSPEVGRALFGQVLAPNLRPSYLSGVGSPGTELEFAL